MAASDVVLLASGTATLEAMLLKRRMVVGYRLSNLSYKLLSRLVKVPWVALPNLLAQKGLVPELLQDDATPEALGAAVLERMENTEEDRKSTRLNSSHVRISYAVFCLKKKNNTVGHHNH